MSVSETTTGRSSKSKQDIRVVSGIEASQLEKDSSGRFVLRVPKHWKAPVSINQHAAEAELQVIEWFTSLGCKTCELQRSRKFDIAGYVGIPFPIISREATLWLGKYLSLWLLWDDVHVEALEHRWKIEAGQVHADCKPQNMTRFDEGWWQLFRDFAKRRSAGWVERLCNGMSVWSDAAIQESLWIKSHRAHGKLPSFADQMEMRIATIGMYVTAGLLEDCLDFELPAQFHGHPDVQRIRKISNEIVGLGNDIFSFGKDMSEAQINLVSTLMIERKLAPGDALEQVILMHERALKEFDRLAASLESRDTELDDHIAQWLQHLRYASLGFTLWESQAPRYTAHKIVIGEHIVAPSLHFVA